jgi:hypothetical protein
LGGKRDDGEEESDDEQVDAKAGDGDGDEEELEEEELEEGVEEEGEGEEKEEEEEEEEDEDGSFSMKRSKNIPHARISGGPRYMKEIGGRGEDEEDDGGELPGITNKTYVTKPM